MPHDITWRNPAVDGTSPATFQAGVKTYSADPHGCHLSIGFDATGCASSGCELRTIEKLIAPTGSAGGTPTENNPTIWQDVFSFMRVLGGAFIPYPPFEDTFFLGFNMLRGTAKLIKHSDGDEFIKFKDDESYGAFSLFMMPSSGVINNGGGLPASLTDADIWEPGIRINNTDVGDGVELKFTVNGTGTAAGVVFAGVSYDGTNIETVIEDAQGNEIDTSADTRSNPIGDFADLDAIVAFYDTRAETNGTWSANLTSLDGTIAASDLSPTAGFKFCFGAFADLFEEKDRVATVAVADAAGTKTMTLRYRGTGSAGVTTTNITLTDAAVDTLVELESTIEGLGQSWTVEVEAATESISNDLGEITQTNCLNTSRITVIYIENAGVVLRSVVQPTDQIYINDTNSLAFGRTLIADDNIDLREGLVRVLGGEAPSDKVLFGPTATEVEVIVARQAGQWLDPGQPPIWKTATPNPGSVNVSAEYASTCKFWRRTDLNVRYTGSASDDWVYNELDQTDVLNTYRSSFGCVVVNSANQVPGSAKTTLANYNLGADGDSNFSQWFTTGFYGLGRPSMVLLRGCNGGPPDNRCPFFQPQDPQYSLESFFSLLMYGEWWVIKQITPGRPEREVDWRSKYSIAALAGGFPDNNSALNTRVRIDHISGGIAALEHADFAEDGSFFKAFTVSNDDTDISISGSAKTILGTGRNIPRYQTTAMESDHVGADAIADWDLIWDSNFLSMKSVDERSESAS